MPLHGKAFLAIWHSIQPGREDEYLSWHTREHFPERLGVPGFLHGRRYVDWQISPHQTLTIYEGAHLETFRSPGYLARLNAPTEWTNAVQPTVTEFLRGGCELLLSLGDGVAGGITSIRLSGSVVASSGRFEAALMAAALELHGRDGVTGVHVGRHAPEVTGVPTAETRLRPSRSEDTFTHVLLVEGLAPAMLVRMERDFADVLVKAGAQGLAIASYPLSYSQKSPA